jgi:hypothetical protein
MWTKNSKLKIKNFTFDTVIRENPLRDFSTHYTLSSMRYPLLPIYYLYDNRL